MQLDRRIKMWHLPHSPNGKVLGMPAEVSADYDIIAVRRGGRQVFDSDSCGSMEDQQLACMHQVPDCAWSIAVRDSISPCKGTWSHQYCIIFGSIFITWLLCHSCSSSSHVMTASQLPNCPLLYWDTWHQKRRNKKKHDFAYLYSRNPDPHDIVPWVRREWIGLALVNLIWQKRRDENTARFKYR